MVKGLVRFYKRAMFTPGILGMVLNPFYLARAGLYRGLKRNASFIKGNILDVGCGDKPYKHLFPAVDQYHGLEIETSVHPTTQADFFYDGNIFPFSERSYDVVLTNQVLEHVFTPNSFLKEINRVLTPEGKLILTVPFVWDEHEQPYDFARYSSFGLKSILEENGFEIVVSEKLLADLRVIFQLFIAYIYKVALYKLPRPVRVPLNVVFIFPITLLALIISFILPGNKDLYLDNLVVAKKIK